MRKAINENPIVQIALVGVLGLAAAIVLLTRMGGSGSDQAAESSEPVAPAASASDPAAVDPAASDPTVQGAAPAASSGAPTAPTGASSSGFVAGPGLPKEVVSAYEHNRTVVLLVNRHGGIDDRQVKLAVTVAALRKSPDIAVFTAAAKHTARYSRITEGVSLDRVPALIVLTPRKLSGPMPEATVSYGYRKLDSVEQAIRDAGYKGPELSYHPE
jgi:hypothetical protein